MKARSPARRMELPSSPEEASRILREMKTSGTPLSSLKVGEHFGFHASVGRPGTFQVVQIIPSTYQVIAHRVVKDTNGRWKPDRYGSSYVDAASLVVRR